MNTVLEVMGLTKNYGPLRAVDGLSIRAERGEIFGLLGHNGAGKTTTIECILGTRKPDSGTVSVLGMDPVKNRKTLFTKVGVQFQHSRFQDKLRVWEACEITASLYPSAKDWRELLKGFGLADKEKKPVKELSGGEGQKLSIVLALIPGPEILFLDELTTGLDPNARRGIWKYLTDLKEGGVTIILTSHYMDEVENLCNRIAILKNGIITAQGTPRELVTRHGAGNLEEVFLLYMDKDEEETI